VRNQSRAVSRLLNLFVAAVRIAVKLAAGLALIGLAILYCLWLIPMVIPVVQYRVGSEAISPDGHYAARSVQTNGPVGIPITTDIMVEDLQAFPLLRLIPPVLSGTQRAAFTYHGVLNRVSITWKSEREIVIEYPSDLEIYGRASEWHDIHVSYVEHGP
jgi:hypothetical protein